MQSPVDQLARKSPLAAGTIAQHYRQLRFRYYEDMQLGLLCFLSAAAAAVVP